MHSGLSKKANIVCYNGIEAKALLCCPYALCTAATVLETSVKNKKKKKKKKNKFSVNQSAA